jgi:hypothetical protein
MTGATASGESLRQDQAILILLAVPVAALR